MFQGGLDQQDLVFCIVAMYILFGSCDLCAKYFAFGARVNISKNVSTYMI